PPAGVLEGDPAVQADVVQAEGAGAGAHAGQYGRSPPAAQRGFRPPAASGRGRTSEDRRRSTVPAAHGGGRPGQGLGSVRAGRRPRKGGVTEVPVIRPEERPVGKEESARETRS